MRCNRGAEQCRIIPRRIVPHEQDRRLQRQRAPDAGARHLQAAEDAAQPVGHQPFQQRLRGRAASGQLPRGGCVHHPAAGAAGAGAPDGAAADAGRGARRLGGADHGRHSALRLRALRQEGCAAHLDCRASRRRPAVDRRREPRADDDAALGAGARVLQRAGRSHERAQGAGETLPPAARCEIRSSSRRISATRSRHRTSPACWACRSPPAASAA